MTMTTQHILDNCDLLVKSECQIIDNCVYEKVRFDSLFKKSDFVNSDTETYYLNNDDHVYRVFLDTDDYDYVTDSETIKRLNSIFK